MSLKKLIDEERVRQSVVNALVAARGAHPHARDADLLRSRETGPKKIYFKFLHDLYLQDPTKIKGSYGDIQPIVKKIRNEMIAAAEENAEQAPALVSQAPLWLEEKWSSCMESLHRALDEFRTSVAAADMKRCISLQHDVDAKVAAGLAEATQRIAEAVDEASESMEVACIFERERDEANERLKDLTNIMTLERDELIKARVRSEFLAEQLEKERSRADRADAEATEAMASLNEQLRAAIARAAQAEAERDAAREVAKEERMLATTARNAEAEARKHAAVMEAELKAALDARDLARKEAQEERERAYQTMAGESYAIATGVSLEEQHEDLVSDLMTRITVENA